MKHNFRIPVCLLAACVLLSSAACGPPDDPELVALAYIRATNSGDPDTAVQLLDLEQIVARVEEEIVVVDSSGRESFLEDAIEALLWGLFRESTPADYIYNATPAELDGQHARVPVTRIAADETSHTVIVELRNTDSGWRVSGESLDPLVRFVVQRLQERY